MFKPNIFAKLPETESLAFYGALFAIAAADGAVDIEELNLIFKNIDFAQLSDSVKNQIQTYVTTPPALDECLKNLSESEDILRLGVMFFLINIAWVGNAIKPEEKQALELAKKELRISDAQVKAIEEFIQTIRELRQGEDKKPGFKYVKAAVDKLKAAGIPLNLIDPKGTTTNLDEPLTYSEESFWEKLKNFALVAGKEVVEKALLLYYALQNPKVPVWARTVILGALAYFVFPVDAVPDIFPVVGYTDDLGVLLAAIGTVAMYINDEVKQQAKQKIRDWFGEE
ncbi:YkvA family protein [Microseira wollei]|uniref:DUF1232 domain-containing protein n=1 Tax=Microseira wollei NIES-4236 TaxID=2530354 RepID=A0AAV3XL61_9CYAN|nr:YkvA family protein [Microseira wollei]GET40257.1 hypothetical protein MiSe_50660 [Microseira wollei NIES-4236]